MMPATAKLEEYRAKASERARTADLMRLFTKGQRTVLEIGAREGFFSRLLTEHFQEVTALDLAKPNIQIPGVIPVQGDVTHLNFPDNTFDCVFCTEVLEHVPQLQRAADELTRVARREVVIGVPYRQDLRVGRTTCRACGEPNPPWGHINAFDEQSIKDVFSRLDPVATSFVWQQGDRTSRLATWLMDLAGNPWGTYMQDEPCIYCGAKLQGPPSRSLVQKVAGALACGLNKLQSLRVTPWPGWMHVLFRKPTS